MNRLYNAVKLDLYTAKASLPTFAIAIIAVIFIGAIATLILYRSLNIPMDTLSFLAVSGFSFAYYCFAVGIFYPIFTRFSFSKAYIFTIAPIFLLFFLLIFLSKQPGFLIDMGVAVQFFSDHPYLLLLCCAVVGLVFLTVSFLIAYSLSRKKEL